MTIFMFFPDFSIVFKWGLLFDRRSLSHSVSTGGMTLLDHSLSQSVGQSLTPHSIVARILHCLHIFHRSCNTSSHGYDSCEDMCCGRGYSTISVEKVERCQCKYHWCCYVQCKVCRRWVDTQECNWQGFESPRSIRFIREEEFCTSFSDPLLKTTSFESL
jgi:hypothetical protein